MLDRIILFPYTIWLAARNSMYRHGFICKSTQAEVPTICVGNVTVGGTGKTPHVEMLLRTLLDNPEWGDKNISVLSRGYKRKSKGFQQVTALSPAWFSGDEPLQIKKKFPEVTVALDKDRVRACDFLAHPQKVQDSKNAKGCVTKDFPASDLIILDDAFQYRKLKARVNILLVDWNRPIFKDSLLPFGRLRDLPCRISEADIVIVTKSPRYIDTEDKVKWASNLKMKDYNPSACSAHTSKGKVQHLFFTHIDYLPLSPVFEECCDNRYSYSHRVVLFSGIANDTPLRMFLSDDYQIVDSFSFPDHHTFKSSDIAKISDAAAAFPTAALATTEKDAQRLLDCQKMPSALKERMFQVPIEVSFDTPEEQDLFEKTLLELV